MAKKVTFTLDDVTVRRIENAAERLGKPKSEVVREAVADFHERIGRLSEPERRRMLAVLDRIASGPPTRDDAEVRQEIRSVREARRGGGRRSG